jgi:hypothetical protein
MTPCDLEEVFMTLTDTQLVILSAASQRPDHAAVLPANLKGRAAKNVVTKLLGQKLLQELVAKDDMPAWRRGDDNRPYGLRITKAGLMAIAIEDGNNEMATASDRIIATDVSGKSKLDDRAARSKHSSQKKPAGANRKASNTSSEPGKSDSKQERILVLLQRPEGATLGVLTEATGWQKHSVRGFLAGTVRKKLKLPLLSEKIEGTRTYRIGPTKTTRVTKSSTPRKV